MLKNRKNKKKKGFTLIELVIVLAVMAIIALIAIPNFTAIRENSKTKADLRSMEVIERTAYMLVSDETISDAKLTPENYVLGFDSNKNLSTVNSKNSTAVTGDEKDIFEAMKEVKMPQGKASGTANAVGYKITISNGEVTVSLT